LTWLLAAYAPRLRTCTQPTQLFAAGAQLPAHAQLALRTGLMAPAWPLLHASRRVIPDLAFSLARRVETRLCLTEAADRPAPTRQTASALWPCTPHSRAVGTLSLLGLKQGGRRELRNSPRLPPIQSQHGSIGRSAPFFSARRSNTNTAYSKPEHFGQSGSEGPSFLNGVFVIAG